MNGRVPSSADLAAIAACLETGAPIRLDLDGRGRLHMDRPMPFIAVHIGRAGQSAAREAVIANAAYLLAPNRREAKAVLDLVGRSMSERFGAFFVLDIGELAADDLSDDAPYVAPFEISLSATPDKAGQGALAAFAGAVEKVDIRYRAPRLSRHDVSEDAHAMLIRGLPKFSGLTIRFAPIHKVPKSHAIYPQLRERLVENIFDAGLQAAAHFARGATTMTPATHRALGRRVFIDAVTRADRAMDAVASRFDFLLAVTPINAEAAWSEFAANKFERTPRLFYRPLDFDISESKKALFAVRLDHLEDPLLTGLYREKQQELDLQLSMLASRESPRFVELGRALYGPVENRLRRSAGEILEATARKPGGEATDNADYRFVQKRAQAMIERYATQSNRFAASIEVREDLPAGLMVSNGRLLIARTTTMAKQRVEALLSHEVGVHLLTYYNGSGHGLRLFRSGLAGYEGAQEGIAVLAEYLAGGMTVARLRLLAARVLACAAMLDGAGFVDTFGLLTRDHGFAEKAAFSVALRVYRGGGLAKDAIYLRGLQEILAYLQGGGALEPFWLGKIAAGHVGVMQELSARGLLKPPSLIPQFLSAKGADRRLDRLKSGLSPIDLVAA
ncbi:flavohemoglobin expression-modulating QEGLA motif protein [Nostoc sp. 3335mG]|nr:flavohemoglobin expression-modulating QEGLA motif protein [Nostoc sp. 3335mG]